MIKQPRIILYSPADYRRGFFYADTAAACKICRFINIKDNKCIMYALFFC